MINTEPRYISELVRAYAKKKRIDIEEAKEIIYPTISYILEQKPYEYVELWTDVGSIAWNNYKIIYSTDPIVPDLYEKILNKKVKKVKRISEIGKLNAKMYENAVYTACKKLYNDAKKTDFNDGANPDVIIPSQKVLVEASARYENPINYHYVWWKLSRWNGTFSDYKAVIFISPNITGKALKFIKNPKEFEPHIELKATWIQYPTKDKSHEGFPLFRKYKYYQKYFREVYRKVCLLSSKQMVEDLIPQIKKAINEVEQ